MSTVNKPDPTIKTAPGDPRHTEELLDEAIEESFPASDPVSITIDQPDKKGKRPDAERPPAGGGPSASKRSR